MAETKQVDVSKEQLREAEEMWKNFTVVTKYCSIVTAVILILLALAFVKFF